MNVYSFNRMISDEQREAEHRQDIVDSAYRALSSGTTGLKNFPVYLVEVLESRVWEKPRKTEMSVVAPMDFDTFVAADYPRGLGSTMDVIESILTSSPVKGESEKALALLTQVTKRRPGEGQERDAQTGRMLPNVDNIHKRQSRPSGTSAEAGIRKLQKAADEGNAIASDCLQRVFSGKLSVNAACVESGLRKSSKIDPDVRDAAAMALAERIFVNFPEDELDAARANAFACGAKALGIALSNVIGGA
jgi:hypothetical protein